MSAAADRKLGDVVPIADGAYLVLGGSDAGSLRPPREAGRAGTEWYPSRELQRAHTVA